MGCQTSILEQRNVLTETFGVVAYDIFGPYKAEAYVSMSFVTITLFFAAWRTIYGSRFNFEDYAHHHASASKDDTEAVSSASKDDTETLEVNDTSVKIGPSTLRIIVAGYIAITALFNIVLMAGLTKFGVAAAALHNLAEWGVVAYQYFDKDYALKCYKRTFMLIWLLITVITCWIEDVKFGFVIEEVLGIWADVMLLVSFIQRLYFSTTPALRGIFTLATFAASLHLVNIVMLAAMGIGLVPVFWGQLIVTGTIVPSFFLYSEFALRWDRMVLRFAIYKQDENPILQHNRCERSLCLGAAAFVIGAVIILAPLYNMPKCLYHQPCKNNSVYGLSILEVPNADANTAQRIITNVAIHTINEDGNMFWLPFKQTDPNSKTTKFAVFEQYSDPQQLALHMEQHYVKKLSLFAANPKMKMSLIGPFQDINLCKPIHIPRSKAPEKRLCPDEATYFSISTMTVTPQGQNEFARRFETLRNLPPDSEHARIYAPLKGFSLPGKDTAGTFALVELWEGGEAEQDKMRNDVTGEVLQLVNSDEWKLLVTSFTQHQGYQRLNFCSGEKD